MNGSETHHVGTLAKSMLLRLHEGLDVHASECHRFLLLLEGELENRAKNGNIDEWRNARPTLSFSVSESDVSILGDAQLCSLMLSSMNRSDIM